MGEGRTWTNGQEYKKLMIVHKALHLRDDIDYVYQEKEKDFPASKLS